MKILFALSSPEYLRFYDTTIRELADRGQSVAVAVHAIRKGKPVRFDDADHPRISYDGIVPQRTDSWAPLAGAIRGTMDFVRYLHPRLADASALRARMKRQALPWILQGLDRIRVLPAPAVTRVMRSLEAIERAIPVDRTLVEYLEERMPDVLLVSPLVEAASEQVDVVRAAQACGIRVATLVASWDNLTNKGDLRVPTDLVVVWNEAQKQEAIELHRVPPERVVVSGAQAFDRWFDRSPSCDRDAFCRMVGLPAGKPFVLYTGSSIFISRADVEVPFVRRWIAALRASGDPVLSDIGVLVRPHPYNGSAWPDDDFCGLGDVTVWPRGGYSPVDEANRSVFFDSLYYCDAVVGINTSAMIEAAVVGRPVFSILTPEFARSQEGTLHFRHLLPESGGCVRVASTFEEHTAQLGAVLRDPAAARAETTRFVESFVRPHGLDTPAMPVLVRAIEQHAATPKPTPARPSIGSRVLRAAMFPLALVAPLFPPEASRKRLVRRGVTVDEQGLKPARISRLLLSVAVVPVLAATLLPAAYAVAEWRGQPPLAYPPPRNVAEAAGMGLEADMLRMLREGQDPARPLPVGPHVISSEITRVSALEAAVWTRRVQLVRLLQREGLLESAVTRQHVACVATAIGAGDIVDYLFPHGLTGCDPVRTVEIVQSRVE